MIDLKNCFLANEFYCILFYTFQLFCHLYVLLIKSKYELKSVIEHK